MTSSITIHGFKLLSFKTFSYEYFSFVQDSGEVFNFLYIYNNIESARQKNKSKIYKCIRNILNN